MASTCSWETEGAQVPKESVEKLLKSFLYAEQIRWMESGSPLVANVSATACSCCNSSLSQDGSHCTKLDPGFEILRHGKNVKYIHAYFQHLEPHRYRLKLTAKNKVHDRPNSSMRVVSSVDPNPQSHQEGTTAAVNEQGALSDQDWQLYEMAVQCYQSPYLSAPPAPSPYSPSSSPTASSSSYQVGFDEFSYSPPPRAQIHSPFRFRRFSFRTGTSPEPIPPANPTTMRELVRKTFGLSKAVHTTQEKLLKEKMQPKNSERVLVEDLLTQLYFLNNNCHPFYRIQSFLDTNGYDEWITAEKENISKLIKVFWHFPLPPCPSAYPLNQFDAHQGYIILLKKFVRHESTNKTTHSVFGDVTPTGPLSLAACRILKEFGLRYGVGELYRKLVYLRYLVNHFEYKLWFIQHVKTLLEDVMTLVTITPEIYVKEEFVMLLHILTLVLRLSKYYLTRVTRLFPKNSPPGGVTSLVIIAELVQDAALYVREQFPSVFSVMIMREVVREFMDNLEDAPFETLLISYLKEEIEGRYERFKVIAADKLEVDCYELALTPHVLNILIYDIQEEITIYKTYYQCEFERYADFVQLATVTFYQLLMTDVQEMCLHLPGNTRRDKVDLRMLALAYRLSILDKDMAKYLNPEMQTWREPFLQLSLTWIDIVGRHLKRLIPVLLEKEPWRAVEVTRDDVKAKAVLTSKVLKITCEQSLFTRSENSAFRKVGNDDSEPVSKNQGFSVSNPNLLSIPRTDHADSSENSLVANQPSVSQSSCTKVVANDTQLKPSSLTTKPDFKGQIIITKAIVHVPKRTDSITTADGGLSQSCPIEDLFIHCDSSDSGKNIEDIDKSYEQESKESDDMKSKPVPEKSRVDYPDSFTGFTGQESETGQTSRTGQTGQTGETGQIGKVSQTGQTGQTGETGQIEKVSQTGETTNEQQTIQNRHIGLPGKTDQTGLTGQNGSTSQTGLTGQTEKKNTSSDKNQNPVITSLVTSLENLSSQTGQTGQAMDREGTPYENTDMDSSATSSNYKTAESSPVYPDLLNIEKISTRALEVASPTSDVVCAVSDVVCPTSDVVCPVSDVVCPTSDVVCPESDVVCPTSDVVCPESDVVCPTSDVVCPVSGVVCPTSDVVCPVSENVSAALEDSKAPIPSATDQEIWTLCIGAKGENATMTTKKRCESCPRKVTKVVPDIEDAPISDTVTVAKNVRLHIPDDDWNKPGPSGLQAPLIPANQHLSKVLESDVTSLRSAPSEYGSLPSRVTVTSYETARYSSDRTTRSSDFESTFTTSYESCSDSSSDEPPTAEDDTPRTEVLPVSSSVVDLLCCVNRLTAFTCHLCSILCPCFDGGMDADWVRSETLRIETALCGRLIQNAKDMVLLYTDSVLAVETCGMTDSELVSVIGAGPARDVIDRYRDGEVVGCRHNPGRQSRCNTTNARGKTFQQCQALLKVKRSPTGCEVVSSKMGIRNSDVTVVESLLPWLHDRITLTLSCHKSMAMGFHGNGGGCQRLSNLSESYCHNGPSVDFNNQGSQQECQQRHGNESRILSQSIDESLDECSVRLENTMDVQCKLVAHRLNSLFKKILHQLLNLSLPTFDTKKRLQPIIDFLNKRLTSLRKVMFPDTFMVTVKYLWRHVVQDFNEEVELLKERRQDATDQSVLVLNSMAYMMQFFHGRGRGLTFDDLISSTETVTKHIELFTTTTPRLIRLYRWLHDQMLTVRRSQLRNVDEFNSSISTLSHQSRAHAPADYLIQSLRVQLHTTRKSFSGTDFVEWVRDYVREHGYDSLGVCIGISDTETGIELGQYLLEREFLACVTATFADCVTHSHESQDDDEACAKSRTSCTSKGTVLMKENALPRQMRFNEISITKRGSSSPQPSSSKSNSRPGTETSELVDSSSSIDSEDNDTRELLDSVDVILRQADSDQSMVQFQNSPAVFYSFISDEDGSGGEFKYKLDFADRFSIRVKLEQIVCVLFTRKRKDKEAKRFLKMLPKDFIAQAIGYKETPLCFHI